MRAVLLSLLALLAACQPDTGPLPAPREPGPQAASIICGMALAEHAGPKGQVYLKGGGAPLWFASARDTLSWLLLDDGPGKAVAAVYVNDMGGDTDWAHPQAGRWVEARKAMYVAGSRRDAAMGGRELVPFAQRPAAERFVARYGGRLLSFDQIGRDALAATGMEGEPNHD